MNADPAGPPVRRWTWMRWLTIVIIVFVIQVALVFIFGAHKAVTPTPAEKAPSVVLAGESTNEWLALNDATLFALPNQNGFGGPMWVALPPLPFHRQDWTEEPHWLGDSAPFQVAQLGAFFNGFMQTNRFATVHFEYNQPPPPAMPLVSTQPPFQTNSTLEIQGDIARQRLLTSMILPAWPAADVIAPSKVQVLVDAAGRVISAVLLPPENFVADPEATLTQDHEADERAVELARSARFAPLGPDAVSVESDPHSSLVTGQLVFNWQSVPAVNANGH